MSLENYTIVLTVRGPIHIGMGKTLRKMEYIYDGYKNLVYLVDPIKLTKYLSKTNNLQKYLDYLNSWGARADLRRFLSDEKIPVKQWQEFTTNTETIHQGKFLNTSKQGNGFQPKDKGMNDLHLFVRDGQNTPYIPGSSLKGALRTVILDSDSDDKRDNKLFSKIKISDSLPIEESNLAIYQKIDINKTAKAMPIYRECLEVGTKVEFTLTIEDEAISISEIENHIRKFYIRYWNGWFTGVAHTSGGKEFISKGGLPVDLQASKHPIALYLGGGAGFVSKTLQYQMYEKNLAKQKVFNELQRKFPIYRKFKTIPANVPMALKATVNTTKNTWYQQGICTLEFSKKFYEGE